MKRKTWIKIAYILIDLVVAFGFSVFIFVYSGISSFSAFTETQKISICIYSVSIALLHVFFFYVFKVYNILSEMFSISDVFKVVIISALVNIVGLVSILVIPNSFLFFQQKELLSWAIASFNIAFLMVAVRFSPRFLSMLNKRIGTTKNVRTLVIGAGSAAKIVVDDSKYNKNNEHNVVVLVDDDQNKIGGLFLGIPVKGPIEEVNKIIDYYQIEEVIIAIADLKQERLRKILEILSLSNVRVKRMPLLSEMQGPNDTRIIDVDLGDLLSREPVSLDNHKVTQMLSRQCILVTGAGGSIGSELVRQIFSCHPKTLVLFDIYENSTYDIQMELVKKMRDDNINDIELVTLIGSTYNETRVEQIIRKYRPDYIYHAAAYKHVPLMEDSPAEAIRTNVIGTYNVAKMADKYNVKKMVLVSTDKAVRPTNVMGATKRFAETIIQYYAKHSKNTKYAAVRFGNVLGSNGSVVPLFRKQIEAGGPITITDKRIIRYFMTIPEAVALILQCCLFAEGGEIFILDMGRPVKIIDLAEKMIRQAGLIPNVDIEIVETGLRPGEKLYEELLIDITNQHKTSNKLIYIEDNNSVVDNLEKDVLTISKVFEMDEISDIKELLSSLITTYRIDK